MQPNRETSYTIGTNAYVKSLANHSAFIQYSIVQFPREDSENRRYAHTAFARLDAVTPTYCNDGFMAISSINAVCGTVQ